MAKKKPPVKSVVTLTRAEALKAKRRREVDARVQAAQFGTPPPSFRPNRDPIKVTVDAAGRVVSPGSATSLLTGPRGTGKAAPTVVAKPKPKSKLTPLVTAPGRPAPSQPAPAPSLGVSAPIAATSPTASPAASTASANPGYKGMTPAQMAKQAAALVSQILGPQIASTQRQYANQGAGAQAAYNAAAKLQEPVAGQISDTYDTASARQAVISKGLAVGAQLAQQETTGDANATLQQNNSPQTVKAADISSVLGTLGSLDAGGMNREGAAFSSAARFLPTQSRNLGIDAVTQAGNQGTEAVNAINARRPELVQGVLGQLQDNELKQRAAAQNDAILAREGYIKETGMTPEGGMPFATRKWLTDTFGVDPITSLPTLEYQRAATAQKQYQQRGKKGGFTASQIRDLKGDALVDARDAFDSETTYQDAILTMLAGGYPLVIAQNALNRFWRQPGVVQAWEAPGKGRPKRSFQQRGGK